MPELPDLTVYLESLSARIANRHLLHIRLLNPFLLRTAVPPVSTVGGKEVIAVGRVGKRIVIELEGEQQAPRFVALDSGKAGTRGEELAALDR